LYVQLLLLLLLLTGKKGIYEKYDSTYMEFLEFVCVMTGILVLGGIIFWTIRYRMMILEQEFAEKRRISAERSKAARMKYEGRNEPEIAPWVPELLQSFGISPETIFEDEIPPELAKFLPLIKGFVEQSGGMAGLLKKFGPGTPDEKFNGL
jgi:hypothetical protein